MSIWNYVFDSEYRQRSDIESLKASALAMSRRSRRGNRELRERVEALEDEVAELTLLCRTLLSVLRQSGAVDPAAFEATSRQIDAEDGVVDGKVREPAARPKKRAPAARRRR